MFYFIYRMVFQLGILDGRTGVIFHFLQGFWFRLIVDVKIDEIIKQQTDWRKTNTSPVKFIFLFFVLFLLFYYFNIMFFGITNPGNHYNPFLANHLNYIQGLRWLLLSSSAFLLKLFGFTAITNNYQMLVAGRGIIRLVYSCLGLGVISFFTAFVIAYPKDDSSKVFFIIAGIFGIEFLNVIRFILLALYWNKRDQQIIDHHTIFNIILYIVVAVSLYFWVKYPSKLDRPHAD